MYDLSDKIILVFGGTGELMGKIAIGLFENKAQVIIVGRDEEKAKKIIDKTNIDFFKFDILNDNVDILFEQIYKKYCYIDMIINGAGINSATPLLDIQDVEISKIFEINFNFVVKCCQLYIRNTLDLGKKGKILNIGSVSGINPLSKVFMYSASKAALHNFSKNIAREYGNRGILTNILVPGFFPAEQNKQILSKKRTELIFGQTPMNRFGEPNELIGMVLLLASNASSFINGAELIIDGGYCVTKI